MRHALRWLNERPSSVWCARKFRKTVMRWPTCPRKFCASSPISSTDTDCGTRSSVVSSTMRFGTDSPLEFVKLVKSLMVVTTPKKSYLILFGFCALEELAAAPPRAVNFQLRCKGTAFFRLKRTYLNPYLFLGHFFPKRQCFFHFFLCFPWGSRSSMRVLSVLTQT